MNNRLSRKQRLIRRIDEASARLLHMAGALYRNTANWRVSVATAIHRMERGSK